MWLPYDHSYSDRTHPARHKNEQTACAIWGKSESQGTLTSAYLCLSLLSRCFFAFFAQKQRIKKLRGWISEAHGKTPGGAGPTFAN